MKKMILIVACFIVVVQHCTGVGNESTELTSLIVVTSGNTQTYQTTQQLSKDAEILLCTVRHKSLLKTLASNNNLSTAQLKQNINNIVTHSVSKLSPDDFMGICYSYPTYMEMLNEINPHNIQEAYTAAIQEKLRNRPQEEQQALLAYMQTRFQEQQATLEDAWLEKRKNHYKGLIGIAASGLTFTLGVFGYLIYLMAK